MKSDQGLSAEQLQAELTALRHEVAELLYYLPDALVEGRFEPLEVTYMNQMAYSLLGYSEQDVARGLHPRDLFATEEEFRRAEATIAEYISECVEKRIPYKRATKQTLYTTVLKRKDGSIFHAETQSAFVLDQDGIPIGVRTIIRDISDRLRAQAMESDNKTLQREIARRKRVEERLRGLYENTPSMYFTVDADGIVKTVNTFGASQLGYEPAELVGKPVWEVFYEPDRSAAQTQLADCLQNPTHVYQSDFRKVTKDGRVIWVRESARAVASEDGALQVLIICDDITAFKRMQARHEQLAVQLRYAQKLESLGHLAGGIAHEFNNLLTGILGNASLSLMDLPPDSPVRENIRQIEEAAKTAATLTRQLLAYAGKGRYVVEPVSLSRLIRDISNLVRTSVPRNIELRFRLNQDVPEIEADASQMQHMVMNLVANAVEAVGTEAGEITLSTYAIRVDAGEPVQTYQEGNLTKGEYVVLEVVDDGCGMDEQTQARVFDPFFTTKFIGRGLGLSAVSGIARSHQGAIQLHSQPGQGTTVRVYFPVCKREEAASKPEVTATQPPATAGAILVVEDEQIARLVAQKILEKFKFKVFTARDGEEGVQVFREHADEIKLVLLDLTMPKMNGEQAVQEIRRIDPEARIILASGYNERHAIARFSGQGLAGFIQKPYPPNVLIEKVREVLEVEDALTPKSSVSGRAS